VTTFRQQKLLMTSVVDLKMGTWDGALHY